jgi:uncharacterized protein YhfF
MRDALVAAVLAGAKTATTALLAQYEEDGEPLPEVGMNLAMIDSESRPVARIETMEVKVIRLGDADLQLALDEGEGFESVSDWRAAHEDYWTRVIKLALHDPSSLQISEDTPIVVERFRLRHEVEQIGAWPR